MPAKKKTTKRASTKKPAAASASRVKAIRDKETKTQIIRAIADDAQLAIKEVKAVFDALNRRARAHVMKRGSGQFTVPELGVKITRKTRPATKKRKGRNPFTGEEIMIPAKPKREVIKTTALKSLKDVIS